MDCFRGATCFAMSISASMGVSGFERCFLESWRSLRKGVSSGRGVRAAPEARVLHAVRCELTPGAQRIACRSMSNSA
jgi:hypothetical protein